MPIHITDLPLEIFEVTLIVGLFVGLYMQNRALKRDKIHSEKQLSLATDELRHLRRMLDKILMVENGYTRPDEEIDDEENATRHKGRPTRLL